MKIKASFPSFVSVACLSALLLGCGPPDAEPQTSVIDPNVPKGTVTFVFKHSDSVRTVEVTDVADGSTLESVMKTIEVIPIELNGSGSTAFVNAIEGQATSGAEGWTFKVDDEFINKGIGVTVLHPPTKVTWTFGEFEAP